MVKVTNKVHGHWSPKNNADHDSRVPHLKEDMALQLSCFLTILKLIQPNMLCGAFGYNCPHGFLVHRSDEDLTLFLSESL